MTRIVCTFPSLSLSLQCSPLTPSFYFFLETPLSFSLFKYPFGLLAFWFILSSRPSITQHYSLSLSLQRLCFHYLELGNCCDIWKNCVVP
ncbi:hypothetical protein Lalb_Chr04g0247921 [Lupinus albus]|uniref:Uncharacterized protein n=1 Tax=Lupinus albus TaxID=3870 RepID=A0A6A4QM41_LUPAL|nr:hypothetical protein Lalb_Chr04g0247921 [Lupinus albus]